MEVYCQPIKQLIYSFGSEELNMAKITTFSSVKIEHIVEKRQNTGYQPFHFFPECFKRVFVSGLLNPWIVR